VYSASIIAAIITGICALYLIRLAAPGRRGDEPAARVKPIG